MEVVAYHLAKAKSGDLDAASHSLRELGAEAFPALSSYYHEEDDPTLRALIVEAIWQHRNPTAIDFLTDALNDPASPVWKQALDGLVTLASPASLHALESAHDRETHPNRRAWIQEAIDQVAETSTRQLPSRPGVPKS